MTARKYKKKKKKKNARHAYAFEARIQALTANIQVELSVTLLQCHKQTPS